MAQFWDLLERSIITQSLLPLMFGGVSCAIWLQGREVPAALLQLTIMCVVFWMGAKAQHTIDNRYAGKQ
ncbi:MAG TPA: hypothetical protein VMW58_13400 [Anaerolineae bacterium]|nr:hypothetical protein [Anaerolineae bacterium]